jgi:DNA ligase (NAD+)
MDEQPTKVKVDLKIVKTDPKKWAEEIDVGVLEALIKKACDVYYNTENVIFTDEIYDILYEILEKREPNSIVLKEVGSEVPDENDIYKNNFDEADISKVIKEDYDNDTEIFKLVDHVKKVKLPIWMGSMDKKKSRDSIRSWLKNYNDSEEIYNSFYILSEKLDGASALITYTDGGIKMYTRGNGHVGRDISNMAQHMTLPPYNDMIDGVSVRGEIVVSKDNFELSKERYATSRAMVNGIMGSKITQRKFIRRLDFVAFELVNPILRTYEQFMILKRLGFKIPKFEKVTLTQIDTWDDEEDDKNRVKNSFLYNALRRFRENANYDIDGIIVSHNKVYPRNKSGNPENSFAFKYNSLGIMTTIKNIKWKPSKHGYLIPTIEIEPVNLGSIVKQTTGFNAKYILDNKLGPGSKIRVVLSGDVIPYVSEIIESTEAQMPKSKYVWNKNKVNILIKDPEEDADYLQKVMLTFFRTINVENLSTGLIKKMVNKGYNTINKIINMTLFDFMTLDGVKEILANKLHTNIHKIVDYPIEASLIMSGSLKFGHGFGKKKFDAILEKYPKIYEMKNVNYEMIESIPGFSELTAKQFVDSLDNFKIFLEEHCSLQLIVIENNIDKEGIFKDKKIVLTGVRDEVVKEFIIQNGGTISNSISKNTHMLISEELDVTNAKTTTAQMLGIPIFTNKSFKLQYNV